MGSLIQDLRYGTRMVRKNPGLTLVVVLTIALGVGANTAVFSVANALLLRAPQGVNKPEEIALLGRTLNGSGFSTFSFPDYADCRDQSRSFVELAAYRETGLYLTTGDAAEWLSGMLVSGNYFNAIDTHVDIGRLIVPEDDLAPGANAVAVISGRLWMSRFGADPNIAGRIINLNNFPFTIVGVVQPGFIGTDVGEATDVWLPLAMYSQADPAFYEKRLDARHISWLGVLGRLKSGVTLQQAQADVTNIAQRLEEIYPDTNKGQGVALAAGLGLQPRRRDEARSTLGILLAIAGLVLLIACANVANLLLVRGSARRKELAVRLALGAGRARLIRQLLTEALITSVMGGVLGIVVAFWSRDLLLSSNFLTGVRLSTPDLRFDERVLGFALFASLVTGFMSGLIPALMASKLDLHSMLKDRGASGLVRSRFGDGLIGGQIALSFVVLVSAGLLVRTLRNAQAVNPGIDVDHILVMPIDVGRGGYSEEQGRAFYRELVDRVGELPGVAAASLAVTAPLGGSWRTGFHLEGQPTTDPDAWCDYDIVAPHYFETMGIALEQGREFSEEDRANSPGVVIVNDEFARLVFPHENPLGKRIAIARSKGDNTYSEIIGVARDIKYERLTESPRAYLYLPLSQRYQSGAMLLVRSVGDDLSAVAGAVGHQAQTVERNVPVYRVRMLGERLRDSLGSRRSVAVLLSIFGLLALALASVGLYAVMAYSVRQRQHEIGIRMALGARRTNVLAMVIRQGLWLAVIGIGIGLIGAFELTRMLESLLFGISATDPLTFIAVSSILLGVALAACFVPARRATKVDPMIVLRYE